MSYARWRRGSPVCSARKQFPCSPNELKPGRQTAGARETRWRRRLPCGVPGTHRFNLPQARTNGVIQRSVDPKDGPKDWIGSPACAAENGALGKAATASRWLLSNQFANNRVGVTRSADARAWQVRMRSCLRLEFTNRSVVRFAEVNGSSLSASQQYGGLPILATAKRRRKQGLNFDCRFTDISKSA